MFVSCDLLQFSLKIDVLFLFLSFFQLFFSVWKKESEEQKLKQN